MNDHVLEGVSGLVVDWDGTVVDNTAIRFHALRRALAPHGIPVTSDWYLTHGGLPIRELISTLAAGRPLPIEDVIRASRRLLLVGPAPQPIPAVIALLMEAQRRGLPRAVASSAASVLVHTGIRRLGLGSLLPVVVTAEAVVRGKPAPDVYLEAARRIGVSPDRCLAVDDTLDGLAAARVAGMRVIAVVGARLTT